MSFHLERVPAKRFVQKGADDAVVPHVAVCFLIRVFEGIEQPVDDFVLCIAYGFRLPDDGALKALAILPLAAFAPDDPVCPPECAF